MPLLRSLALGAALATMVCASSTAKADSNPILETNRLNRPSDTIGTIGSDLFGEQVDLYSGGTEFNATDISIPGNSGLPVRLGRHFKITETDKYGTVPSFSNWEVDVPYLSGYFAEAGWVVGSNSSTSRCSIPVNQPQAARPPDLTELPNTSGQIIVYSDDYWHGYQMYDSTQKLKLSDFGGQNSALSPDHTNGPVVFGSSISIWQ